MALAQREQPKSSKIRADYISLASSLKKIPDFPPNFRFPLYEKVSQQIDHSLLIRKKVFDAHQKKYPAPLTPLSDHEKNGIMKSVLNDITSESENIDSALEKIT